MLWTGDTFMPELYLKQPEFIYNAYRPFTKHCERIQKFRKTYRNEKACFALDAAYLAKRTILNKIFEDRGNEIAGNCKYDGYQ